jgi:hypothetical protein
LHLNETSLAAWVGLQVLDSFGKPRAHSQNSPWTKAGTTAKLAP